ncbi:MAG TPA: hypothetical protein VNO52_01930, partial [Methylomirabilota bacterium]|nr:hypothetical protein [Methylomirabilota bacterium]
GSRAGARGNGWREWQRWAQRLWPPAAPGRPRRIPFTARTVECVHIAMVEEDRHVTSLLLT